MEKKYFYGITENSKIKIKYNELFKNNINSTCEIDELFTGKFKYSGYLYFYGNHPVINVCDIWGSEPKGYFREFINTIFAELKPELIRFFRPTAKMSEILIKYNTNGYFALEIIEDYYIISK